MRWIDTINSYTSWALAGMHSVRKELSFRLAKIDKFEFLEAALFVDCTYDPVIHITTWEGLI